MPMTVNGVLITPPTTAAMIWLSTVMPQIRHQERRTSRRERERAVMTPCFSSMRAGAARLSWMPIQTATGRLSRPTTTSRPTIAGSSAPEAR